MNNRRGFLIASAAVDAARKKLGFTVTPGEDGSEFKLTIDLKTVKL